MTVRVGIEFITGPAAAAAKRLQGNVDKLRKGFERLTNQTNRTKAAFRLFGRRGINVLRDLEGRAAKLGTVFGGLRGAIGKAAVGFAAFAAVQAGISRETSERRLRLLTSQYGEFAKATEIAERAAKKFNLSQTEANTQLSRLIARLRPMGLSMEQIETAFAGFNTATILAGATASESAGAFLQLSQALGSGVLRGQELNSILEQAPLIAQAIAQEMDTTVGSLKKFGEEGQITSAIVIAALERVAKDGAGQLEEALNGPAAAIKSFQNASEEVQVALTDEVIPQLTESFKILADIILELKPVIKSVGDFAATVLGGINDAIQRIRDPGKLAAEQQAFFAEGRMKAAMNRGQRGLANFPVDLKEQEAALFKAAEKKPIVKPPALKDKPPEPTKAELRRLQLLAQQKIAAKELAFESQAQLAIEKESSDLAKIDLKFDLQRARLQREYAGLLAKSLSDEERGNLVGALRSKLEILSVERNAAISGHMQDQFDALSKVTAEMLEMNPFAQQLSEEFQSLANTINNEILSGIEGMIEGTKTLGQVASSMLKKIASQMLQTAIMGPQGSGGIAGMLFGALGIGGGGGFKAPQVKTAGLDFSGAFASGGRPPVGKAALVGERGPELFVPRSSGTIVPNNAMGGSTNVVVNVDASGTEVQGSQNNADQLGRLIGQAVQAELIKQKRPGGLLTR